MSGQRPEVLVVEDDSDIRTFISFALTAEGYDVVGAENGAAALEALRASLPDLILLDIRMPVMDGRAFLREYRRSPAPHAPIIVITAARDAEATAGLEADGFLSKPFDLEEMIQIVASHVRRA